MPWTRKTMKTRTKRFTSDELVEADGNTSAFNNKTGQCRITP